MPLTIGPNTPTAALAATAASTALPPWDTIVAPLWEGGGRPVATMPYRVITMDRAWVRSWAWASDNPYPPVMIASRAPGNGSIHRRIAVHSFNRFNSFNLFDPLL